MEHLHSKFNLLVNSIKNNHTLREVYGLAISLAGSAERVQHEHKYKGEIRENLGLITIESLNLAETIKAQVYKILNNKVPLNELDKETQEIVRNSILTAYPFHAILPNTINYAMCKIRINDLIKFSGRRVSENLSVIDKAVRAVAEELQIELGEVSNSKFNLLVNSIKSNHTLREVYGLAISLAGSAERVQHEHRYGGKIKDNLRIITREALVLAQVIQIQAEMGLHRKIPLYKLDERTQDIVHKSILTAHPHYEILPPNMRDVLLSIRINDVFPMAVRKIKRILRIIDKAIRDIAKELKIEFEEVFT